MKLTTMDKQAAGYTKYIEREYNLAQGLPALVGLRIDKLELTAQDMHDVRKHVGFEDWLRRVLYVAFRAIDTKTVPARTDSITSHYASPVAYEVTEQITALTGAKYILQGKCAQCGYINNMYSSTIKVLKIQCQGCNKEVEVGRGLYNVMQLDANGRPLI